MTVIIHKSWNLELQFDDLGVHWRPLWVQGGTIPWAQIISFSETPHLTPTGTRWTAHSHDVLKDPALNRWLTQLKTLELCLVLDQDWQETQQNLRVPFGGHHFRVQPLYNHQDEPQKGRALVVINLRRRSTTAQTFDGLMALLHGRCTYQLICFE